MNAGVSGIDFGNSKCVIGIAKRGLIDIAANELSSRKTPSVVAFTPKKRVVGENAVNNHARNWKNTTYNLKMLLGKMYTKAETQQELRPLKYETFLLPDNSVGIRVVHQGKEIEFRNESVIAILLAKLKKYAETNSSSHINDCAISVPSFFTIKQRHALNSAARIAGLNCLSMLSEPAAAALSYGIQLPIEDQRLVIFADMGHSSTGFALVEFKKSGLKVLRTEWTDKVGCRNFDDLLVKHIAKCVEQKDRIRPLSNPRAVLKLYKAAERAKSVLSINRETRVFIDCLMEDIDVNMNISREEFENMSSPLIQTFVSVAEKLVTEGKLQLEKIHSLEFLGGGTRIPCVMNAIEKFFGRPVSLTCNPDETVAKGATLKAAMISPLFRVKEYSVIDCFPFSVNISWGSISSNYASRSCEFDKTTLLFGRFSPIPTARIVSFSQKEPFQFVLSYADMKELPEGSDAFIGRYIVYPPKHNPEDTFESRKIKVKIAIDTLGRIHMQSVKLHETREVYEPAPVEDKKEKDANDSDKNTEKQPQKEKEPENEKPKMIKKSKTFISDLKSEETIERMTEQQTVDEINGEVHMRKMDEQIDLVAKSKNDLEEYVFQMITGLETQYKDYVKPDIAAKFLKNLNEAESWLYSNEADTSSALPEIQERLRCLSSFGDSLKSRKFEHENFNPSISKLINLFEQYKNLHSEAESGSEKFNHLDADELKSVKVFLGATNEWINGVKEKRSKAVSHEDFEVKIADISLKYDETLAACMPVFDKPKPKVEEVKEEAKTEEAEKEETPKKEEVNGNKE